MTICSPLDGAPDVLKRRRKVVVLLQANRRACRPVRCTARAGIDRIFRVGDRRSGICRRRGYMNFVAFEMRGQPSDHWRRGVDDKAVADAVGGERLAGIMRRRIAGDDLDPVAAVGQQRGVEGVELFGDIVFEQPPVGVVVGTKVDGVR